VTQARSVFDQSVVSAGAIARGRAVSFGRAQVGTAGAKALGIAKQAATASGQDITVAVIGTAVAETGAQVAVGDSLVTDDQGRMVPASLLTVAAGATGVTSSAANGAILTGADLPQFVLADALQAASGAGAFIEVFMRR